MLALTPQPLQTAGERALFAELARWDTGGAVRAAVVASLPTVTDGPLQRRLSDAVLFVPEGLAVVRIVEVERQRGIVKAAAEGAWTISPDGGPGEVLQLGGGGSTPLDGLMRAGMDAAVRLRRAGLEPGRIARLTVLVGDVTGLDPADGDLGEGDLVATTDPRSLLLGISRSARYTAVDNLRVWTTADVRAALEALGLTGRVPTVQELNGEGFAYSPYVLRRPELIAPVAVTAAATAPPPVVLPADDGPVVPAQVPAQAPAAPPGWRPVAPPPRSAQPAPVATAVAPAPSRDTVDLAAPPEPAEDTGGIGGLFGGGGHAPAEDAVPAAPGTAVLAGQQPAAWSPEPWAAEPATRWSGTGPADPGPVPPGPRRSGRRALVLAVAALVVLAVVAVGGLLLLTGGLHRATSSAASTPSAPVSAAPEPALAIGSTRTAGGQTFTLQALKVDTTCAGHAYGQVAGFFTGADCTGLSRALYSTTVGGHAVVVAVSHTRMADAAAAGKLRQMADSTGTGNVSDLLREGITYSGGPAKLGATREYASSLSGDVVTIVETDWASAAAGSSDQLDTAAEAGTHLPVAPFSG